MTPPLPCIVCAAAPEPAFPPPDDPPWRRDGLPHPAQPYGATTFYSYGQYGSTAFDPEDESQIEVNVCDACLADAGQAGKVWHSRHVRRLATTLLSRPWRPDAADGGPAE